MQIAKSAHSDAGGMGDPIPRDLLKSVTILSPNETELLRLTGIPTKTVEAAKKLLKMVLFYNLFFSLKLLSLFC